MNTRFIFIFTFTTPLLTFTITIRSGKVMPFRVVVPLFTKESVAEEAENGSLFTSNSWESAIDVLPIS